jgi:ferric citrate transport system substrate-binding protein
VSAHPPPRRSLCLAGCLLAAVLAGACASANSSLAPGGAPSTTPSAASNPNLSQCGKDTRQITDALGVTTTITGVSNRIVTIELSFADDVTLLGSSPVGIGDDNDPNLLIPQIKSRLAGPYTSVGVRESPNLAVIAGLKPDLIFADRIGNAKVIDQLRAIAPTLALPSQHTTYQQNIDTALTVGAALNQCARMRQALDRHDQLMAAQQAKVPSGEHRSFVFGLASGQSMTIFNQTQYTSTVLALLGLSPAATDPRQFPSGDSSGVSLETLAQLNPDIVFYANALDAKTSLLNAWAASPVFQSTTAARQHTVFLVGQKPWSLTRGVTGAEVIAEQAVGDLYGK